MKEILKSKVVNLIFGIILLFTYLAAFVKGLYSFITDFLPSQLKQIEELESNGIILLIVFFTLFITSIIYYVNRKYEFEFAFKKSVCLLLKIFIFILTMPVLYAVFGSLVNKYVNEASNWIVLIIIFMLILVITCMLMFLFYRKLLKISFGIVIMYLLYLTPISSGIISIPMLGEINILNTPIDYGNMPIWLSILLIITYIDKSYKYIFGTIKTELFDDVVNNPNSEELR